MNNPIIGITLDEESSKTYSKYPWYAARKNYSDSIELAGGTSIFLPHNLKKIEEYLNIIDGLLVTGGDFDVDPKLYGEKINNKAVKLKKKRTEFEIKISSEAIKNNFPVLGICGGQQLLNGASGGSLIQHIPDKINTKINHEQKKPRNQASHYVEIKNGTKLYKITKTNRMFVNSAHHQAVDRLGKGFLINAIADDGVIEGIENPNLKFCIGIQWHPEFLIDKNDIEIFRSFIKSSKKS